MRNQAIHWMDRRDSAIRARATFPNLSLARPRRVALLLLVLGAGISGCANDGHRGKPAAHAMESVRTVSIDTQVALPDTIHYLSAGQVWGGAVGGMIGAAIMAASSPEQSIRMNLEKNNINIDAIFIEEMGTALAQQSRFQVVDHGADAVLSFQVKEYGFHVAGPFTAKMKVLLKLESQATGPGDTPLFRAGAAAWNTEITRYTMDEYFEDRTRLLAAFHEVAAAVAAKEVNALLRRARGAQVLPDENTVAASDATPSSSAPNSPGAASPEAGAGLVTSAGTGPLLPPAAPSSADPATASAAQNNVASETKRIAVARQGAKFRDQPSLAGPVIQTLAAGSAVELSTRMENDAGFWWFVTIHKTRGWVAEGELQMR
jgi:hypothetical protein